MKFFVRALLVCAAFFLALALFLEWREYREAQRWEGIMELLFETSPPVRSGPSLFLSPVRIRPGRVGELQKQVQRLEEAVKDS